jgi:hypothetical protein
MAKLARNSRCFHYAELRLQTEVSSRPERSEVEGPAVPFNPFTRGSMKAPPSALSSRPERTRISCRAALDKAAYAPFRKEGRMKCTNATKVHRKSGGAQWRDLQFYGPFLEMFRQASSAVEEPSY